jgi:uncharacterized membrane protein
MSDAGANPSTPMPAVADVAGATHEDAAAGPACASLPEGPVRAARAIVLGATLALVVLGLAWELWLAPTGARTLAVKVLPLGLAVPGLLRHRMATFRWLSLLVWLYVLEGLLRATTEHGPAVALAIGEVALAFVLFTAAAFYIRRRLASSAAAASTASAAAA